MERKITEELLKWKNDILRKPLLLYGPKQIGKTYSAISFGKKEYKNIAYFNSNNYRELKEVLTKEKSVERIIIKLSALCGETILKQDTLIIIDNVDDLEIIKGIKLFGSNGKNDYHIIAITSLKENVIKFKGEELQYRAMYPMDFEEYLMAIGKDQLIEFIKESYRTMKPMPFHSVALEYFQTFLMVGGFPEAVKASIDGEDKRIIASIHHKILDTYKKECLKLENLIDITRCEEVLNSIPYQLQKTNKKFQYGLIGFGHRSKEYENAIEFLSNNQFACRCYKISEAKAPLSSCKDKESFKLYLNDTGLLYTMMHLNQMKFLTDTNTKNIIMENSIATTLIKTGFSLYYYQSEGKAEISFVIQSRSGRIIPIELVNKNLSKSKSLTLFLNKFTALDAIRITEDNFNVKKKIKYIPIYALFCLKDNF